MSGWASAPEERPRQGGPRLHCRWRRDSHGGDRLPAKEREYRRRWNEQHRVEYQRRYREIHGPGVRSAATIEKHKAYKIRTRAELRQKVFDLLGDTCARCGFADKRALQFDHINGGGTRELRELKHAVAVWKKVLATGGEGYQTLCANCNWIKRSENNECARES